MHTWTLPWLRAHTRALSPTLYHHRIRLDAESDAILAIYRSRVDFALAPDTVARHGFFTTTLASTAPEHAVVTRRFHDIIRTIAHES